MVPSPLPYDPCWTAKLIRRDIHNLKAKAVSKVKARFARPSKPSAEAVDVVIVEPEIPRATKSTQPMTDDVHPSTLYDVLEGKLKTLWASRNRDVSPEERWQFRGSWLVLWNAVQACPSNPCYNVFEKPKADETALLLDLVELSVEKTSRNAHRVSKMPVTPYEGKENHVRIDSVFSASTSSEHAAPKPTTPQLWHSILEGVTDDTRTISVAEELLIQIWPEKNVGKVLDKIGNPSELFLEERELRFQFRDLLFPSYSALSAPRH